MQHEQRMSRAVFAPPFSISHQIIDPSVQIPAIIISTAKTIASADKAKIPPINGRTLILL